MIDKKYILVLVAGLFGILSVYFDQRCYRLEKKSSDLLTEINDTKSLKEFCFAANEHLAHIQDEINHIESIFINFDYSDRLDLEGYYNDLKSQTYDMLNDLSKQKNFNQIKGDGFEELMHALRMRSTSYQEEWDTDTSLFDYITRGSEESEIFWYGCFNTTLGNSYEKYVSLLNAVKDLRSVHNGIIYKRQTAIIASMISSLISIFLIIVFFKFVNIQFASSKKSSGLE